MEVIVSLLLLHLLEPCEFFSKVIIEGFCIRCLGGCDKELQHTGAVFHTVSASEFAGFQDVGCSLLLLPIEIFQPGLG